MRPLMFLFLIALALASDSIADAKPFRRTKAVARTGPIIGGTKAKAKVKHSRIRRISVETTPEQAVKAGAPGQQRWADWDANSRRDVPGQGRQNDDLR